jgi:hypothetical protein
MKVKLESHRRYRVRNEEMYFWRYRSNGIPEFYYYAQYGDTKHIIYYWDRDLRADEIEVIKQPMIV